jgi:hypothetical protein
MAVTERNPSINDHVPVFARVHTVMDAYLVQGGDKEPVPQKCTKVNIFGKGTDFRIPSMCVPGNVGPCSFQKKLKEARGAHNDTESI